MLDRINRAKKSNCSFVWTVLIRNRVKKRVKKELGVLSFLFALKVNKMKKPNINGSHCSGFEVVCNAKFLEINLQVRIG